MSDRHAVNHTFHAGELLTLKPFEFKIPVGDFEINEGDWITFEIASTRDANGRQSGGFVYVHARIPLPPTYFRLRIGGSGKPFEAESDPVMHGVAVKAAGRIESMADGLIVVVTSCSVRPSDHYPTDAREVISIAAVVTRGVPDGATGVERASERHSVRRVLDQDNEFQLQPFDLKIRLNGYSAVPNDGLALVIRYEFVKEGKRVSESAWVHLPIRLR